MSRSSIPTYATAADVLSRKTGSGAKMVGWTILRTLMIAPPMMIVGVPAKQAWLGASLSSALISTFAIMRIFDAKATGLAGTRRSGRRCRQLRCAT
jgi:hypothetical protein